MQSMSYELFFTCTDALSYHLMLENNKRLQIEADMLVKAGKATMSCDITKRDKHGKGLH